MNPSLKKTTCRALVVSVLALSFHTAQAGLISADQAAGPPPSAERTLLLNTLDRAEVVQQLQAAGIDPSDARARVSTMSDTEVNALVQDIQTAPAGQMSTAGWLAVILVVGLVWYFGFRK